MKVPWRKKASTNRTGYLLAIVAGLALGIALGAFAIPQSWKEKVNDLGHEVSKVAERAKANLSDTDQGIPYSGSSHQR